MRLLLTTGLIMLSTIPAHGQCGRQARGLFRRPSRQACSAPQARFQATTTVQSCATTTTVYAAPQGAVQSVPSIQGVDYGFGAWLNSIRAQYGRGPVAFDSSLAAEASANNGQQLARGLGHHYRGRGRLQNVGWGGISTVSSMWMASPAHRAALLSPSITTFGFSVDGDFCTFCAN